MLRYEENTAFMDKDIDTNDVLLHMFNAMNNATPHRLKGYYGCIYDGEFIKAVGKPTANCPYCGRETKRLMTIDPVDEMSILMRWKADGIYSDLKADVRKNKRKER